MDGPPRSGAGYRLSQQVRPSARGRIRAAARGKSRVAEFAARHGGNRAAGIAASHGTAGRANAPPLLASDRRRNGIHRGGEENFPGEHAGAANGSAAKVCNTANASTVGANDRIANVNATVARWHAAARQPQIPRCSLRASLGISFAPLRMTSKAMLRRARESCAVPRNVLCLCFCHCLCFCRCLRFCL